jgi:hypothetical protein
MPKSGEQLTKPKLAWMQTYRGGKFYPRAVEALKVDILDIAHSLAITNRYNGHTHVPYSVAQHSCLVHDYLPEHRQAEGLLHDATEAYLGDVATPLKLCLPEYEKLEDSLWVHLSTVFDLPPAMSPEVREADRRALMTERRDLMVCTPATQGWGYTDVIPWQRKVKPWGWAKSEREFLKRFFVHYPLWKT